METNIKNIIIYNDGLIEIKVECKICKNINIHNISHSSVKIKDNINIDFTKLGSRMCDGNLDGKTYTCSDNMCCNDYKLYK